MGVWWRRWAHVLTRLSGARRGLWRGPEWAYGSVGGQRRGESSGWGLGGPRGEEAVTGEG